jgi:hypothetical protein
MTATREEEGAVVYQIDRRDVIVFINDRFRDFAVQNQAPSVADCLGQPLWSFIADWDTKAIYQLVVDRVRREQIAPRFSFRCDSPAQRRFMEMEIGLIAEDRVEFRCRMDRIESRTSVNPASIKNVLRVEELVRMCSWCTRIQHASGNWHEIEESNRGPELIDLRTTASHHAWDLR